MGRSISKKSERNKLELNFNPKNKNKNKNYSKWGKKQGQELNDSPDFFELKSPQSIEENKNNQFDIVWWE